MAAVCWSFRRHQSQRECQAVLAQWHAISAANAVLQQQGRSAARQLQALRLRQAWQLWRRAHRQELAARQRQYSKMVYELLKVCQQSSAMHLFSSGSACCHCDHV